MEVQSPPPAADAYKSIRLSGDRRRLLTRHAKATLYTPDEEDREAMAHAGLLAAVLEEVNDLVPQDEVAVLKKYDCTQRVSTVLFRDIPNVSYVDGRVVVDEATRESPHFCFCPRLVRVARTSQLTGCHRYPREGRNREDDNPNAIEVPGKWAHHVSEYVGNNYGQVSFQALDIGAMPSSIREPLTAALLPPLFAWLSAKVLTDAARRAVLDPLHSVVYRAATLQAVAEVWPEAMRLADQFEGVRLADEAGAKRIATARFGPPPPVEPQAIDAD